MLVQLGLCRTCSEITLLVFPRDGSIMMISLLPGSLQRLERKKAERVEERKKEKRKLMNKQTNKYRKVCLFNKEDKEIGRTRVQNG